MTDIPLTIEEQVRALCQVLGYDLSDIPPTNRLAVYLRSDTEPSTRNFLSFADWTEVLAFLKESR